MELLDIVDENNNITGEVEERTVAHRNGLWHRHVSCWIMNERGEILLQKRTATKNRNPNKWSKTGGHVDSKESVKDALKREVNEELGIELIDDDIELIEIYKSKEKSNKHFGYDFFINVKYLLQDYILQEEEVSDVKYVTIEEMIRLKKERDEDYTFVNWNDEDFYNKIEILKNKRREIVNKSQQ